MKFIKASQRTFGAIFSGFVRSYCWSLWPEIIDVLDGEKNIVKEKIDENNYSQQEGDNLNSADAKLIELKKTLANYSISSLEYKAVAQEINRLEKLEKNR